MEPIFFCYSGLADRVAWRATHNLQAAVYSYISLKKFSKSKKLKCSINEEYGKKSGSIASKSLSLWETLLHIFEDDEPRERVHHNHRNTTVFVVCDFSCNFLVTCVSGSCIFSTQGFTLVCLCSNRAIYTEYLVCVCVFPSILPFPPFSLV